MIIHFTDNPYVLENYKLLGDIHSAFNRIGKNASTATIRYYDKNTYNVTVAYYNRRNIVAIDKDGLTIAVIKKKGDRYHLPRWATIY